MNFKAKPIYKWCHFKKKPLSKSWALKHSQHPFLRFLMISQPNKVLLYYRHILSFCLHFINTNNQIGKMMGRFLARPCFIIDPDKMETSLIGSLFFFRLRCGVASIFCFLLSFHSPVYITLMIHIRLFPTHPPKNPHILSPPK